MLLEWVGAALALAGAVMFSMCRDWSKYGWLLWVASSACLLGFALDIQARGLATMQAVFLLINLNGVWRWLGPGARAPSAPGTPCTPSDLSAAGAGAAAAPASRD